MSHVTLIDNNMIGDILLKSAKYKPLLNRHVQDKQFSWNVTR